MCYDTIIARGGDYMANTSNKIDEDAVFSSKLKDILEDIPNCISTLEDLVELLEGIQIPGPYPDADQYHIFCQAYTIRLLRKYVVGNDSREILFASYRLLAGYENFTSIKECHEYYAEKALGHNKQIKKWGNPNSSLQKLEKQIIEKLAERLTNVAKTKSNKKPKLNLAGEVTRELSERFPNGLPKKLPLPAPSYLAPETIPKRLQPLDMPPVEELFPTAKEIELIPGEIFQLKVAVLPREAVDAPLSFVSLDPKIVTVSADGMLKAEKRQEKLLHNLKNSNLLRTLFNQGGQSSVDFQTTEIIIQAESGVTATKPVAVDYSRGSCEPPVTDINEYVLDFLVTQKVRLVGDNTWHNYVDAKVGDKIEIQTQYKNTDFRNNTHENVAMKAVLPKNLKYVSGSTLLFTTQTPNGLKKEDGIAGNGIYIGTYGKDSNAYVRFTAEVVDENLVCGTTGLVNWVQASVDGVTLQDYVTILVTKE